jgi:hypothetical protein
VLTSRTDYEWVRDVIRREKLHERVRTVLLSPVQAVPPGKELPGSTGLALRALTDWMRADTRAGVLPGAGASAANGTPTGVRLQAQLHKLIWDPATRGV